MCALGGVGAGPRCLGTAVVVGVGALEVAWCDAARPEAGLAGALAGSLACFGFLGLAALGGSWSPGLPWG